MITIATRPTRQFLFELDKPQEGTAYIFIRRPNEAAIQTSVPHLFQMKIAMPGDLGDNTENYKDAIDVCMAMHRYRKIVISCDDSNSIRRGTLRYFLESQYPVKTGYNYKYDKKILSLLRQSWASVVISETYRTKDRRVDRNMVNCVLENGQELTAIVYEDRGKILEGMMKGANLLDVRVARVSIDEFDSIVGHLKTYSSSKNLVSHIKSLSK